MKALTFISSLSLGSGGPSRSVPLLVRGLSEAGIEVTLMTVESPEMNTHALEGSQAQLHVLPAGFIWRDVEAFVRRERFDLIQGQSVWEWSYHRLKQIADHLHIPYLSTPRGMLEPWALEQKRWKKRLALLAYQQRDLRTSHCVLTTAAEEAAHVRALVGAATTIAVVPNGLDTSAYPVRTCPMSVRHEVLFLSRIHEKKGVELLLTAWPTVTSRYPDYKLRIVGNGEAGYIASLQRRIEALHLQDTVSIEAPIYGAAKCEAYQSASLFVLPTYSENFGMVIAEAMASGTPVITTTGTPWRVLNEATPSLPRLGWCVAPTSEALTEALLEALALPEAMRYEMGQQSSAYIRLHFHYTATARSVAALYEYLVHGGTPPNCIYGN